MSYGFFMLKRKFTIHLDAIIVISLLFLCSTALNILLIKESSSLGDKIFGQELKLLENEMNLDSQKRYIEKLRKQINEKSESTIIGN